MIWLKKLTVLFLVSGLAYVLVLYTKDKWIRGRQETFDGQRTYHADLVIRLRGLDIKFHKFIALSRQRDIPPNEEVTIATENPATENPTIQTTTKVSNLRNLRKRKWRWNINSTYYKAFKLKNKIFSVTQQKCTQKYKMLILVQSYITHRDRRDSIRKTWGNCTTNNPDYKWKALFIIGKTTDEKHPPLLAEEMSQHNDILLFNTGESFYNLTEKLQKGFQWVAKHCNFHYMLKCDDDVFVNVAALYTYLEQEKMPRTELFTGHVMWWSEVYRSGRYAIDEGYKREVYPRYCSGGGYVLSKDVVVKFIELFPQVPYMRIDDAYFGELALKAGLYIIHSGNFRMWADNCDHTGLVSHSVKTDPCMTEMYRKSSDAFSKIGVN